MTAVLVAQSHFGGTDKSVTISRPTRSPSLPLAAPCFRAAMLRQAVTRAGSSSSRPIVSAISPGHTLRGISLPRAQWKSSSASKPSTTAISATGTEEVNGTSDKAARQRVLKEVMKDIDSRFGKGTIWALGSSSTAAQVETTPSGVLMLDLAMGGGYPKGRIIEIFGPESSGKTTLALHAIAEVQKLGGTAALVDAEHAFEPMYAQRLGVNLDDLLISQPFSGEDALNIVDSLVRSMAVDIIAVDSVAALVPRAELEGEIGNVQIGAQARLMSSALRKLVSNASKCNCTVIFLNQLRQKVGVIYGNPEVTSGGNALKYYASVRVDVRRKETLKEGGEEVGIRCKASVKKNKVAPPYKVADFDIMFGSGISRTGSLLDSAVAAGITARKGAWYSYGNTKLGMGKEKALQFLEANPEILKEIETQTRDAVKRGKALAGFGSATVSSADEETDDDEVFDEELLDVKGL